MSSKMDEADAAAAQAEGQSKLPLPFSVDSRLEWRQAGARVVARSRRGEGRRRVSPIENARRHHTMAGEQDEMARLESQVLDQYKRMAVSLDRVSRPLSFLLRPRRA